MCVWAGGAVTAQLTSVANPFLGINTLLGLNHSGVFENRVGHSFLETSGILTIFQTFGGTV